MIRKLGKLAAAVAALTMSQAALAGDWLDSASLEAGGGDKTQILRLAVQKDWNVNWFQSNGRHLGGYWDANVAYWRGTAYKNNPDRNQNLWVFGVTPVFRYQNDNKLGWYGEAGIGVSVFSELYNNADNRLSTAFEFADHVGVGYVLENKWDLGVRLQHYSNGGIKHPNSGVNLLMLRAVRPF
jgi:lipid A 3-O-deacylase